MEHELSDAWFWTDTECHGEKPARSRVFALVSALLVASSIGMTVLLDRSDKDAAFAPSAEASLTGAVVPVVVAGKADAGADERVVTGER